jgi:hypothetical protein
VDLGDETGQWIQEIRQGKQDGDVMVKASDEKVLSESFCLPEGFD